MVENQQELENMPKKDLKKKFGEALGGALLKMIEAWRKMQDFKEKVSSAKEEVLPLMKKENHVEIKVDGLKVKFREGEEGVTISKEPNKE